MDWLSNRLFKKSGFLLIEVILALGVFSIVVFGVSTTLLYGSEAQVTSGNRQTAMSYARSGLEAVRDIRNQSFGNLSAGTYGVRRKADNSGYELYAGPDTQDIYSRTITLVADGARAFEATADVSWTDTTTRSNDLNLTTRITDWQRTVNSSPIKVTTYEIEEGFTGNEFDLELLTDLSENYFTMIIGSSNSSGGRGPGEDGVRVVGDPFANFAAVTNDRVLRLRRGRDDDSWEGVVVVVESTDESKDTSGFELVEVLEDALPDNDSSANCNTSVASGTNPGGVLDCTQTMSQNKTANMVPYGGLRGGGVEVTSGGTSANDYAISLGTEFWLGQGIGAANTYYISRYEGGGRTLQPITTTTYMVEWGSEWNIQEVLVPLAEWDAGGNGADAINDYATFPLATETPMQPVNRANTWVWASTGYSRDDGLGDGALGKVVTLGDGVSQNIIEDTVAVGSEYGDLRRDTFYVHSHPSLNVEYRFKPDNDQGSSNGFQEIFVSGFNSPTLTESYGSNQDQALGILSVAGINGTDGPLSSFYTNSPIAGSTINVLSDEDQIADGERNHAAEELSYLVFSEIGEDIVDENNVIIGETGIASSVGNTFQTINFKNTYIDPVVVATPTLAVNTNPPVVTRVNNVGTNSFDLMLQNPGNLATPVAATVYFTVIEKGNYELEGNVDIVVDTVISTLTASTVLFSTAVQNDVTPAPRVNDPIVFGQVMTFNDSDWSHFWSSSDVAGDPAERNDVYIGKHVGQDLLNLLRMDETIGYMIIEQSNGVMDNGVAWDVGLTTEVADGPDDTLPNLVAVNGLLGQLVRYTFNSARFAQSFETSSGVGNAFSRPVWAPRFESPNEVTTERQYAGQPNVMWFQSVDFGGL